MQVNLRLLERLFGLKMSSQERERQAESQDVVVSSTVPECPVCLQVCIHPSRLPCNHIFCYLCVKGVANQSKRCPMCRQEIPADYLERPQLLEWDQQKETAAAEEESSQEAYQWFYEGRNGWWQYDQRTSLELETAYKQGKRSCELLIAGFLYIADFGSMLQLRRNDHSRRRRIKRDLSNAPKKGVAGLRLNNTPAQEQEEQQQPQLMMTREIRGAERPASPIDDSIGERSDGWPITPSNTPQTLASSTTSTSSEPIDCERSAGNSHDSLHEVLGQMRSLMLRDRQQPVAEDPGLRTTLESLVARGWEAEEGEEEDVAEGEESRQE